MESWLEKINKKPRFNIDGTQQPATTKKDIIFFLIGITIIALLITALGTIWKPHYDGNRTGQIGETLNFSETRHKEPDIQATIISLEKISPTEAQQWGMTETEGDIYFLHYKVDSDKTKSLRVADFELTTASGKSFRLTPFPFGISNTKTLEANCKNKPQHAPTTNDWQLCIPIIVPTGETITSIRYYGIWESRNPKMLYQTKQWITWYTK